MFRDETLTWKKVHCALFQSDFPSYLFRMGKHSRGSSFGDFGTLTSAWPGAEAGWTAPWLRWWSCSTKVWALRSRGGGMCLTLRWWPAALEFDFFIDKSCGLSCSGSGLLDDILNNCFLIRWWCSEIALLNLLLALWLSASDWDHPER